MGKKGKPKKSAAGADCLPDEVDTRPESSPYAADIVSLVLKDGTVLKIPSPLLCRCPKLPRTSLWGSPARLEIAQEVGHVLVHYLFTDTYQCLRPKALSPHEKVAAEFTTSIQVYALAREYELSSLEELAKLEIERLGNGLRFPVVLDLVRDAYPNPSADDTWFSSYLKSGLKSLLRNPSELSDCDVPNTERKTLSVGDLLFKGLVELLRNHEISPRGLDTAPQVEALEESALLMPVLVLGSPEEATLKLDDSGLSEICGPVESEPGLPETSEQDLPEEAEGEYEHKPWSDLEPEKAQAFEPEPEPEPGKEDGIRSLGVSTTAVETPKKKKKKKKKFEPKPELGKEDDIWSFGVSTTAKEKKKKNKKKFEPKPDPGKVDGWSLCESDDLSCQLRGVDPALVTGGDVKDQGQRSGPWY